MLIKILNLKGWNFHSSSFVNAVEMCSWYSRHDKFEVVPVDFISVVAIDFLACKTGLTNTRNERYDLIC